MLNLLKLLDIVKLHTGIFMLCFCNGLLPVDFDHFFSEIKCIHVHYTRLASKVITYALPLPRTNYGIFSIRFSRPKVWNSIEESLKILNVKKFKKKFKNQMISDKMIKIKVAYVISKQYFNLPFV